MLDDLCTVSNIQSPSDFSYSNPKALEVDYNMKSAIISSFTAIDAYFFAYHGSMVNESQQGYSICYWLFAGVGASMLFFIVCTYLMTRRMAAQSRFVLHMKPAACREQHIISTQFVRDLQVPVSA